MGSPSPRPSPAGRGGKRNSLRLALLCAVILVPVTLAARALEGPSVPALQDTELQATFRRLQELYLPVAINRRLWDLAPSARAEAERTLRRFTREARGVRLAIAGMQDVVNTLTEEEPLLIASAFTDAEPPYLAEKRQRNIFRWAGDRIGLKKLQKTITAKIAAQWEEKGAIAREAEVIREALAEGEWRYAPFGFAWENAWFAHNAFTRLLHDARRAEGRRLAHALLAGGRDGGKTEGHRQMSDGSNGGTSGPIHWPLQSPRYAWRISAGFLDRWYANQFGAPHLGIDFVVNQGTTVRSMADGVVLLTHEGKSKGAYNYVLIVHADGLMSLYGHLSSVRAQEGEIVMAGQPIGWSGGAQGTSGAGESTGAHLHFEVLRYGIRLDPLKFLTEATAPSLP